LRELAEHGVRFVVIGGLAAALHGSSQVTFDIDIVPDSDFQNLARLSDALTALEARVRASDAAGGLALQRDAAALSRAEIWNLHTLHGDLDLVMRPAGTGGYKDLDRDAQTIKLGRLSVRIASLADVIRSKEAAGREKDRAALPALRRLLSEISP
jgi:hypothetical protein